ncbi:1-acyl-sn-glycerol-3-phosphate acyltransferase [Sphingomonas guangdongensis]|uniref:1-acyl-sn-glycerol-3-phosphate acyltransferase n=1 Tax=Sphingomonas guangdongensis TaxID=1141890 RepID=A0A285QFD4_9SPHN|nr:lysophospholipid acyltransferase family protein [Sphingomonas guangdongensis]SOB80238.1 1-acyl-sn-glycerol-3-phosphate acyltransferase [Sphingomonas guangdongensis]
MAARLRTLLFQLVFYAGSLVIVLLAPVAALFGERPLRRWVLFWTLYHRWCAAVTLGIRPRITGAIPTGPALYVAKHQAMFETLEMVALLRAPAIVMKQELARIPVWGWAARRYGMIVVDRSASATAMREMMREAKATAATGRSVVIFPEGTRVAPGETPPLKPGFAGLYRALALPVVPVAIDSGIAWPRHGPKRPNTPITFRFGEVIPAGQPRDVIEQAAHRAINVLERAPDQ